ncbi:hypothetical protein [Fodinibius sp. AD559]|uniref:hypothetical protein n=1 Tax=Fodinibius sp. AD559 TaxID=3424179 RepID=UPI004046A4F3
MGQDTETIIVDQPNSPIEIKKYEASFEEEGSNTKEGIQHKVVYINSGRANPIAIKFGFVSFNIFNEYLGIINGIAMVRLEGRQENRGTWVHETSSDFSFYTGIAFVNKVRFENGEIWEADSEIIIDTLKEIKSDFDASVLADDI